MLLSGCFMSDPEPYYFGFRVAGGRVEVLFPLCPGEALTDVSGFDMTGKQRELFAASAPTSPEASAGRVVVLGVSDSGGQAWLPEGFAERTVYEEVPVLPKFLGVGYRSAGGGADDVTDTEKAAAAVLGPDQYWTREGPRTAGQINQQFRCNAPR
ncbi:hypothetical protein [Kitasatospora sp. NPDC008115]|uniref:hypothetical protein n=1 Tax=Kitasatospora sp. NPDC008115 TaxID=3364022 RepID=UPI0036F181A2